MPAYPFCNVRNGKVGCESINGGAGCVRVGCILVVGRLGSGAGRIFVKLHITNAVVLSESSWQRTYSVLLPAFKNSLDVLTTDT